MKRVFLVVLLIVFASIFASDLRLFNEAKDFYNSGDYKKSEDLMQIVSEDIKAKPEYHKLLAQVYIAQQKFDLACDEYELYQEGNLGIDHRRINKIKEIIKEAVEDNQQKKVILKLNYMLGDINSTNSDFAPVLAKDKKKMYYTSLKPADYESENIWVCDYRDGLWTNSKVVSSLSSHSNESISSFSEDGKTAYLFGNYHGANEGDIFYSTLIDQNWTKPENLHKINSEFTDMQPYVYENVMFFASNRSEGQGGFDIYVSEYKGSWKDPINLGTVINTNLDEESPFFDWDGKTLYFASNGHPGLGELDLFKSEKIGNSWQEWSEPENLGVIINSVRNDRCFSHLKNDNNWFLASDRIGGKGYEDIYSVYIEDVIPQEVPVTRVFGVVKDESGNTVQGAQLFFKPQTSANLSDRKVSSNRKGEFEIKLPGNEVYLYNLDKEGYFSEKGSITLTNVEDEELNFTLKPMGSEPEEIEDIFFGFDNATLRKESFSSLDLLVRTLQVNPTLKAEISAHTCNIGSEEYNLILSKERATSVVNYLIEHGISTDRLSSKGYGESRPKYSNETEEDREMNRRVEMKLKKM